eukprot:10430645-Alexandrium_andersonii.AAC.1
MSASLVGSEMCIRDSTKLPLSSPSCARTTQARYDGRSGLSGRGGTNARLQVARARGPRRRQTT